MNWKEKCLSALDSEKMFEDSRHKTRFKELVDCFSHQPFFTKGLCKCIYLSAWDDEHFCVMVEMLNELSLGRETDTEEMSIKGDALAEEEERDEAQVYRLSIAFLENQPYSKDIISSVSPETAYIIRRALQAAAIIDQL